MGVPTGSGNAQARAYTHQTKTLKALTNPAAHDSADNSKRYGQSLPAGALVCRASSCCGPARCQSRGWQNTASRT